MRSKELYSCMFICRFILFMHAINDSDKVGNLYDGDIKKYLHNKINNDFFLTFIVLVNKSFISIIKVQTP